MNLEIDLKKMMDSIAKVIPGFNGYYKKETRREEDRNLRERIANRLKKIEDSIYAYGRRVAKKGDMAALERLNSLTKRIEKLNDTIRYSNYGYTGFFDLNSVSEDILKKIIKKDFELIEWFNEIPQHIENEKDVDDISSEIEKGFGIFEERLKILKNILEG